MNTGGEEIPTASQFAELLTAIKGVKSSVDEKLSQLRRKLKDERESADKRLVKKMRLEKRTTFRKIGNEKQYIQIPTRRCKINWTLPHTRNVNVSLTLEMQM